MKFPREIKNQKDLDIFKKEMLNLFNGVRPMAAELIYDYRQTMIVGWQQIDPETIICSTDPQSGKIIWIQYPTINNLTRVLLDGQIVQEGILEYTKRMRKQKINKICLD